MKQINLWVFILLAWMWTGCKEDSLSLPGDGTGKAGEVMMEFVTPNTDVLETRATGEPAGDTRLENVLVFAFNDKNECVAKQWTYLNGANKMAMYLPTGVQTLWAAANLLHPEEVMERVNSLSDLEREAVTIIVPDGAYKGKYVMAGKPKQSAISSQTDSYTFEMERLAAQFNVDVVFDPVVTTDKFMLSEISLHSIPNGSWLLPRTSEKVPGETKMGDTASQTDAQALVVTADGGDKADYVYHEQEMAMARNFFDETVLQWEKSTLQGGLAKTGFSLFENRRGTLSLAEKDKPINWPKLENKGPQAFDRYAQFEKKQLAAKAGFTHATYLKLKGVYQTGVNKFETTYYVYLGKDAYSDFNVERNTRYNMIVTIQAMDKADSRIDKITLNDMKVYYNEAQVVDAHFNAVQTLLYAPGVWEMWVEEADEHPWLELSTSAAYVPQPLGDDKPSAADKELDFYKKGYATSHLKGKVGMQYIYVHTDEYVPPVSNLNANLSEPREARVGYRCKDESGRFKPTKYFTVKQYPAQMAVLHIKYDVHTMKEVCDTFYVERILEKKNLQWGFLNYWSFVTDDLIAAGTWDGLANTRRLYDVALKGDKWGVDPAYPSGVIPSNVGLRYVIDKNRDRNGNEKIDYNEIVWYMPAIKELQALQKALVNGQVDFDGKNDYFFTSTPSSADPNGFTTGFAYYVKMQNGKRGISRRDSEYNVIALRRKNAWKGPESAGGNGTVDKDPSWNEEENIMPK